MSASISNIIKENDKDKLKTALEIFEFDSTENEQGQNILHVACKEGHKDIVSIIIQIYEIRNKTFDLGNKEDNKKWTPIYYAIDENESGFPEIVDLLLKNGSDANKIDDKGITALHLAAYKGQDDNVEILLKHKANPNIADISGRTPLNYAIMEGQTNSVQALFEANADLSVTDVNGDSLMHYAILCKGNALLYVIMLHEKGINIDAQNLEGDTALNLSAKNGAKDNVRVIQKLLEFKADPTIQNNKGESFYDILSNEADKDKFNYESENEDEKDKDNLNEKSSKANTQMINTESTSSNNIFLFAFISIMIAVFIQYCHNIK